MKQITMTFLTLIIALCSFAQGKLEAGDDAPLLEGLTWKGLNIGTDQPIGNQSVLLVFYQGSWNTYDTKFIAALGTQNDAIKSKEYRIILVTPEKALFGEKMLGESGLQADVILDDELINTSNYGLGLKMSKKNLPDKFDKHAALNRKHTGRTDNVVPVPACLIIGPDGKIKWMHKDWDYRRRPTLEEVMGQL
jgi:peroxiredoxin